MAVALNIVTKVFTQTLLATSCMRILYSSYAHLRSSVQIAEKGVLNCYYAHSEETTGMMVRLRQCSFPDCHLATFSIARCCTRAYCVHT
jgi:hypothetical protein